MSKLTVHFVVVDPTSGHESRVASVEADDYDADTLDALIQRCLEEALRKRNAESLDIFRNEKPEISVALSAEEEEMVRPAFHLSGTTIRLMADAGADFDFDPYV